MSNLGNLVEALCHRLEDGLERETFEDLKMAGVRRYRLEAKDAKTKVEPFVVVAPAGIGSGWQHDGSHPYASAGIAVLVYPGNRDRKSGSFKAAQAFSDKAHKILQDCPVPFIWPDEADDPDPRDPCKRKVPPLTHVISIRLESGPEPVVLEGTSWPCMSRIYNVNANTQEAYDY